MSEELTDSAMTESPVIEETHTADIDNASETTAEGEEQRHEKVTFTPEQQRILDTQAFEARKAKREADAVKQQLEQMQTKAPAQQPRPNIPEPPRDYDYDDDNQFKAAVAERDAAIQKQTAYDAQEQVRQQIAEQAQVQSQQAAQQKHADLVDSYTQRAKTLGIDNNALLTANAQINAYGIPPALADFIMSNDHGPAISMHLADNPLQLDKVANMSPVDAAVYISENVKPAAVNRLKKVPSAPAPVDTLNGTGVAPKSRGPAGATFE